MAVDRTEAGTGTRRRRDGGLLSAVSAVAGAWLGWYAGDRVGGAIADSRGQQGLDGIVVESIAAVIGLLAGLWLLVLVALLVTGRSRPLLTATLAAALAAVGLVAVVLVRWVLDLLGIADSTPDWYDRVEAVLLTLVVAAGASAARRLAARPPRRDAPSHP